SAMLRRGRSPSQGIRSEPAIDDGDDGRAARARATGTRTTPGSGSSDKPLALGGRALFCPARPSTRRRLLMSRSRGTVGTSVGDAGKLGGKGSRSRGALETSVGEAGKLGVSGSTSRPGDRLGRLRAGSGSSGEVRARSGFFRR